MTIKDDDTFASKPFTFVIQGKPLHVHTALVADCSEPFNRMINGHLAEAQQGSAVLQDVDEATFVRFIRWMYSRDYPARKPTTAKEGLETEITSGSKLDPEAKVDDDEWGLGWGAFKKNKKKKRREEQVKCSLKESFVRRQDSLGEPESFPSSAPRSNKGPEEDYTEPLRRLALRKLQRALAVYTLYAERIEDILALLRYVYANTSESIQGVEDIRTMLAHYIACEMEILIKHGEIKELMMDHGEMLGDFLTMFVQRISCEQ